MPEISIVVPVLNGEKFIKECAESLINQTFCDMEILFVDAGSTDGTLEILEQYASNDSRVKILKSDKKSMGYQYNLGMDNAKGDFIGFCEADDYVAPTMYEELYNAIAQNDLDYVKSDYDMFVNKDKIITLRYQVMGNSRKTLYNVPFSPDDYPELIMRDVNMWNGLYKTSFIRSNNIRLNETPKAAFQDTGFVLQTFGLASKIMYIDTPSYYYRRDNMGSSVYKPDVISYVEQEFVYIFDKIKKYEGISRYKRAIILRRFIDLFGGFYSELPAKNELSEDIIKSIDNFRLRFTDEYNKTESKYLEALDFYTLINAQLVIQNKMELFDHFRREAGSYNQLKWSEFKKEMEKHPSIMFYGCTERNRCACAFLLNNDVKGIIGFCDDNVSYNKCCGMNVITLENALANHTEAIYIIDNLNSGNESYKKLIDCGIDEGKIFQSVRITTHAAFEKAIN